MRIAQERAAQKSAAQEKAAQERAAQESVAQERAAQESAAQEQLIEVFHQSLFPPNLESSVPLPNRSRTTSPSSHQI